MATRPETDVAELDSVRLVKDLGEIKAGTEATVIAAHPEVDSYLLEVYVDGAFATIESRRIDFEPRG